MYYNIEKLRNNKIHRKVKGDYYENNKNKWGSKKH